MMRHARVFARFVVPALAVSLVWWWASASAVEPSKKAAKRAARAAERATKQAATDDETLFLRVLRDKSDRPTEMQTAIVHYAKGRGKKGVQVDLIGAVHIGDAGYYAKLNKQFENYDALLYELVAPAEHRVPRPGKGGSSHPVALMQTGMKDLLELEHQLEKVDYRKKNFVHADMSPDEFSKAMEDRDESIWTMIFRAMGQGIAQQSKHPERSVDMQFFTALFDPNRALALKRAMAGQFEDLEGAAGMFDGPDGSAIITDRNRVALEVLKKEIAAGKKKIGIFYGAAHLPDMEKHLESDFGLKRQGVEWLTAWDLRDKKAGGSASGR